MKPSEILNLLLGAGFAGFLTAVYRVVKDWRQGTWRRQDTAIADLEKWRRDADDAREWAEAQHQWWRQRAGRLEYVIMVNLGPDYVVPPEPYPVRPDPDRKEP